MALQLKPLRCPHCDAAIEKRQLQNSGHLKAFLKSQSFPCPHCKEFALYPENADTLLSVGILITVILAPLLHLWEVTWADSKVVFGLGIIIVIAGMLTQKLAKGIDPQGSEGTANE